MCRVHSGIRVHLTLHGHISLYIYPIGPKCTSDAFSFHAKDGKNILFHSSTSVVVNWWPPPPPCDCWPIPKWGLAAFFLCCGALLQSGVRLEHLEGVELYEALGQGNAFLQEKKRWRVVRMSSVLEQFPDGVQGQDGHSTSIYFGYPPPPPPPRKRLTLIPEWPLLRNAHYILFNNLIYLKPFPTLALKDRVNRK